MRVDLEPDELDLLACGLRQWGGPARPSDPVAALLGLRDAATMSSEVRRIADALEASQDLEPRDWNRALTASEIAFVSDSHGAGVEWETGAGLDDGHTIEVLRRLQRKLVLVERP